MIKPFDSLELFIRVKNLIDQRRKLHECFSREPGIDFHVFTTTSLDEKFLKKLKTIIEDNISSPGLDVDLLISEMNSSYSYIYRKIKALVGVSPAVFIRFMRLSKARDLLKNNQGNVSEVAFEVGFESLSYFSRCFMKQFGRSPSVFVKQNQMGA